MAIGQLKNRTHSLDFGAGNVLWLDENNHIILSTKDTSGSEANSDVTGGGGGSVSNPTWAATELQRAQTALGETATSVMVGYGIDFVKGSADNTGVNLAYGSTGVQVDTTAVSGKICQAVLGSFSTPPPYFLSSVVAGGKWYLSWLIRAGAGAFAATEYHRIGVADSVPNSLNFYFNGPANATKWRIQGTRVGGAFELDGTGTAATVDATAAHRMAIVCDGASIDFRIDNVSIGNSTALSGGNSGPALVQLTSQNGGSATIRRIDCEQVFACWVGGG